MLQSSVLVKQVSISLLVLILNKPFSIYAVSLLTMGSTSLESVCEKALHSDDNEMLQQLKDKFVETQDTDDKYRILTTLPKSWSIYRILKEFGVSQYMAERAKKLQLEKGIMSIPDKKSYRNSSGDETLALIQKFFTSDDISRACPGKRDYVITTSRAEKVYLQRRLIMCNLKEAYALFKEEYPTLKIGFSFFASHRPKECILAGSSGTHTVCVCIYHQNVKLMVKALQDKKLLPINMSSYHDFFKKILCASPREQCWLKTCVECPGVEDLQLELVTMLSDRHLESLQVKQWRQADRCVMDSLDMDVQYFVDLFTEKLRDLSPHNFIAEQQSNYLKFVKSNMTTSECIIICDFSENYSFVVQDAVQGYHWANAQCTIHPCSIYYKESYSPDPKFTSYVAIAEFNKHNHVAVRLFLVHCIQHIKKKLPGLSKIYFFSDGSGGQYKNKMTAYNLCKMPQDFGLVGEWNFFATCHGKGPCDALGGVLKRNATKASLQGNQITTALELYAWASANRDSKVHYAFFEEKEYRAMERKLKNRYVEVNQIAGTQSFHFFRPQSENSVIVKRFSFSEEEQYAEL